MSFFNLLELANDCRHHLRKGEAVCLDVFDPYLGDERRLVISPSEVWGEPGQSIMVAYEGGGVFFLEAGAIPTEFDLMARGYSFDVAVAVYSLLAHILRRQQCRLRQRTKVHNKNKTK